MDSTNVYLRVNKEDIYVICPYFEAFEGMVAIRTPAPEPGPQATIKLMVSPDFKEDFEKLLANLSGRIKFERILTPSLTNVRVSPSPLKMERGTEGGEE